MLSGDDGGARPPLPPHARHALGTCQASASAILRSVSALNAAWPTYVYFNNDNHGHAAFNALTLRRMAETEA